MTGQPPSTPPPDVPALLRALLVADAGRPRLTWYGPDGERVELSAKVLDNWVAKSANLLVDEVDAGPGSAVLVDLPGHWRTLTWLLAGWATGAAVVLPGPGGPDGGIPALPAAVQAEAVVTWRPEAWQSAVAEGPFAGAAVLAVALPALAPRFPGPLPAGAVDAAAQVRGHGDVFVPRVRPVAADPALVGADGTVIGHGDLIGAAAAAGRASGVAGGARVLTGAGPQRALDVWLAALAGGGSLVLHHDLPGLDAAARHRLRTQEGITLVL